MAQLANELILQVILTAPSSEECGSSSTDSVSSHLTAIHRPQPEGQVISLLANYYIEY